MASSTTLTTMLISSNTNNTGMRPSKKKKESSPTLQTETHDKWRSGKQQQLYCSKLIKALTHLNRSSKSSQPSHQAVREAADRALASVGRGRPVWSRAMLTSQVKLKSRKQQKRRGKTVGTRGSRKAIVRVLRLKGKISASVQRRAKLLGQLVPGCHKQPFDVVLEETADYIAALEMQVRAMTALTNLLSTSTSASDTSTIS